MTKQFLLFILLSYVPIFGFSQIDDTTFQDIDEVVISSKRKKKIVFEDPKYYIVDFSITENNAFLLMKNLGRYYIYELDENMQFRHKLRIKMNANSLFQDCFGNTHLVTRDSVYFILNDEYGLFLTESHPKKRFMNAMEKCVGKTKDKIVFERCTDIDEYQTFYTMDVDSAYKKIIYEINDSTLAFSKRNEDKDREKSVTEIRIPRRYLLGRIQRPQKYNPLFIVDDTLYIFNHFEGRLDQLDDKGNVTKTLHINHHKKKGWKRLVYSEMMERQFYAVWMKNGAQHLIGLAFADDEQNFSSKITKHAYPEKVIVRNGYAYYTYKPNMDANLNKLYQQKL